MRSPTSIMDATPPTPPLPESPQGLKMASSGAAWQPGARPQRPLAAKSWATVAAAPLLRTPKEKRWFEIFQRFDLDGSNTISLAELEAGCSNEPDLARKLGLPSKLAAGKTTLRQVLHGCGVDDIDDGGGCCNESDGSSSSDAYADELQWAEFRALLEKREERRRLLLRGQIAGGAGGGV